MDISLDTAKKIVRDYSRTNQMNYSSKDFVERETYWFFGVEYIGSCGVIVDKADGRLFVMGSGLTREELFWGHENGFSPEFLDLEISTVNNVVQTRSLVGSLLIQKGEAPIQPLRAAREIAKGELENLPYKIAKVRLWLKIPWFREAIDENWISYAISESET